MNPEYPTREARNNLFFVAELSAQLQDVPSYEIKQLFLSGKLDVFVDMNIHLDAVVREHAEDLGPREGLLIVDVAENTVTIHRPRLTLNSEELSL